MYQEGVNSLVSLPERVAGCYPCSMKGLIVWYPCQGGWQGATPVAGRGFIVWYPCQRVWQGATPVAGRGLSMISFLPERVAGYYPFSRKGFIVWYLEREGARVLPL